MQGFSLQISSSNASQGSLHGVVLLKVKRLLVTVLVESRALGRVK